MAAALSVPIRLALAFCLSLFISLRSVKKRSLTHDGAVAATLVGTVHLATGLLPATLLLVFFFTSSAFTKVKGAKKVALTTEADGGEKAGRRAVQVRSPLQLTRRWPVQYTRSAARLTCQRCNDTTLIVLTCVLHHALSAPHQFACLLNSLR